MDTVVLLIRIVLAAVFVLAGVGKLLDLEGSRRAVRDFGVPDRLSSLAGPLLPIAELAAAVMLVIRPTAQIGAALALVLLLAFIGGIANALRQGMAPDCHCFGQIHSAPAGPETLIRNGVLAALAVVGLAAGPGPNVIDWLDARSAAEIVAAVLGIGIALIGFFFFQLWTEVRKLRVDIANARRQAAGAPPGLPVGFDAPDFELTSVEGETVSLSELRQRGNPILLTFTSPYCSSCAEIFPNLRRWQQTLQDRLTIALISSGAQDDNEELQRRYGLEKILIQDKNEVLMDYRIRGTPSAVLVTEDGRIGTLPAESVFGIEPMVRLVLRGEDLIAAAPQGSAA
jgi:peroxiredoxin/uncharacterized membrane protein YphA (DoxX/SURF4 family)